MIREIVKDTKFLMQKSAKIEDIAEEYQLYADLVDTARANTPNCVGLAAPQIGVLKRAIVVKTSKSWEVLINPTIIARSKETYKTFEGCLSLDGEKEVKRNKWIKVAFHYTNGNFTILQLGGFPAEVIQHEIDHLNGILI